MKNTFSVSITHSSEDNQNIKIFDRKASISLPTLKSSNVIENMYEQQQQKMKQFMAFLTI